MLRSIACTVTFLLFAPAVFAQGLIHSGNGGVTTDGFGHSVAYGPQGSTTFAYPFIAVGAPFDDTAGSDAGRAEFRTTGGGGAVIVYGPAAGAKFGWSVAVIGDITGDNVGDVAVGAPGDDTNGTDAGAVYIFDSSSGALLKTILGTQAGEQFGFSVARIEDVNADGKADLGVGSPYYDASGLSNAGRMRVYSTLSWFVLVSFNGQSAGESAGWCVADGGDQNNDGISEIMVGAPWSDVGSLANAGRVYVINGLNDVVLFNFAGFAPNAHFGSSLYCSGLSASAVYVAGAPDYDGTFVNQGYVRAFSKVNGNTVWTQYGNTTDAYYGTSIGDAGASYYYDDWADHWEAQGARLAIGAPGQFAPGPIFQAGAVEILLASTGEHVTTQYGSAPGQSFGTSLCYGYLTGGQLPFDPPVEHIVVGGPGDEDLWSGAVVAFGDNIVEGVSAGVQFGTAVSGIGDVNGDGKADFAVGAPFSNGTVNSGGRVRVLSGADESILFTKSGTQANARYGSVLAPAGDINLDGKPDLIVGAPDHDTLISANEGAAYILSGANGATLRSHLGTDIGDRFGSALAGGADINGDGRDDYALGAPAHNTLTTDAGQFKVYSGATGLELYSNIGITGSERLGYALAMVGDVNLDGFVDFAAGAPGGSGGAGYAKIYSGKTGSTLRTLTNSGSDELGRALAAGDINLDGVPDLLVSALRKSAFGLINQGAVLVYSGSNGALLTSVVGEDDHEDLGITLAYLGDQNRDGFGDFAAGAVNGGAGGTISSGVVRIFSGADCLLLKTVAGNAIGDKFGSTLAALGDVDLDGLCDWIAGAPGSDENGTQSGQYQVWNSAPDRLMTYGIGTFGCLGPEPIWANSTPAVGNLNFRISLTSAPSSSLVLGLVADADFMFGQDTFGLGINMHVDLISATEVFTLDMPTDAAGRTQVPAPIPNNPLLHGRVYYAQTISYWPAQQCSPSPMGLSSSQGLKIDIL